MRAELAWLALITLFLLSFANAAPGPNLEAQARGATYLLLYNFYSCHDESRAQPARSNTTLIITASQEFLN